MRSQRSKNEVIEKEINGIILKIKIKYPQKKSDYESKQIDFVG